MTMANLIFMVVVSRNVLPLRAEVKFVIYRIFLTFTPLMAQCVCVLPTILEYEESIYSYVGTRDGYSGYGIIACG